MPKLASARRRCSSRRAASRPTSHVLTANATTAVISKAAGYQGFEVRKGIESPERYVLMIRWATLENHTVDFRGGPLFPQWRAIVGPFFAVPPVVEHFELVAKA